jgi:hypothetical protein
MKDFSRRTLNILAKKGITLIGTTLIPGDGPMPMANGTTGYCLNDNGTHRVVGFGEILNLAK